MKTKDMEISHVTQNEYVEKINLGGFFESFVTALCYFTLKKKFKPMNNKMPPLLFQC